MISGWICIQIREGVTIPMLGKFADFLAVDIFFGGFAENVPGVVEPRDGGGEHIKGIADKVDDARIGEKLFECRDFCAK